MSTKLRFIFVSAPQIKDFARDYTLNTSCKDVKRQIYTEWPTELGPVDYSKIRLIVGGQSMDDTKMLNEYPVCTPGSTPAVHIAVLPSDIKTEKAGAGVEQGQKQASCCVIQ